MPSWSSYSALGMHRGCPQAWKYRYIDKIVREDPEDLKVAMYFGTWGHALRACDSIDRGKKLGSIKYVPEEIICYDGPGAQYAIQTAGDDRGATLVEAFWVAMDEWWSGLSAEAQEQWVSWLGQEPIDRLMHLHEQWEVMWAAERKMEEPLAVEFKWTKDLPKLPTGEDPDTNLIGYVDEIFFDRKRNIVVARDHKFHKALGTQSTADDLMDSQLQVYAWGASAQVKEWGLGPIRAVAYDRSRSVAPKMPSLTASGSLSKSVTDYDLATYLEWVGEGVAWGTEGDYYKTGRNAGKPKFGTYTVDPAIVEALSQPDKQSVWFQRTLRPLNVNVVKAHLTSAVDTALDIANTRARVERQGMAGRNLTGNCKWCDYVQLCRAQMVGGNDGEYDLAEMRLRKSD